MPRLPAIPLRSRALAIGLTTGLLLGAIAFGDPIPTRPWTDPPDHLELASAGDLATVVAQAPCRNRDRLAAVRRLFHHAGAEEIQVQEYKRVKNVVVTLPGASAEQIVIGAHYDKTRRGCGAIDNWSGIVTLAEIYRTVRQLPLEKTLVFVAFGREEEGLIGSRAMVRNLEDEDLAKICAMVNIDSLGLSWPQVALNLSADSLSKHTRDLADRMVIRHDQAVLAGSSDSRSFLRKGVPALTIHGLPEDFLSILHTDRDQAEAIRPESLYLAYRLVLGLVAEIDQASCRAWR